MKPEDVRDPDEPVTHRVIQAGEMYFFRDHRNEEYPVRILDSRWIAEGGFGAIYQVRCRIGELLKEEPEQRVIKSFHSRGDALPAWRKHAMMANLGFPVFSQYDLQQHNDLILMPDGNENSRLTVSQNESIAREELTLHPLRSITDYWGTLRHIVGIVRRSMICGVLIPSDAYFFFARREGPDGSVAVSVDDVDNVEGDNEGMEPLIEENIRSARVAFEGFLAFAVVDAGRNTFPGAATEAYFNEIRKILLAERVKIQKASSSWMANRRNAGAERK